DRPQQIGFRRIHRLVDVVAIEAEPGFQTQRIPRAETDGQYFGLREQRARNTLAILDFDGDLKTIFARVAGAADNRRTTGNICAHDFHEGELVDAWRHALQYRTRDGALQREQRAVEPRGDRRGALELVRHIGVVAIL